MKESWRATGASVRGVLHIRHDLPNEDAVYWSPPQGPASSAWIAVADGHGSSRCFRSATGASLAVKTGTKVLSELMAQPGSDSDREAAVKERLPRLLVESWLEAVAAHCERDPFTEQELDRVEREEGPAARREALAGPAIAYGTTLALAGADDRGVVVLQIGDGDILTVSDTGFVSRPLARDPKSVGDSTASLAVASASRDARVRSLPSAEISPALVLASTDGYANSFEDDAGFLQVGSDLLTMIRDEGFGLVAQELERWLSEVSELGSGDDVSVGLLVAGG